MQSIPYDPALVLGNLVDEKLLKAILDVSAAAAPVDAAHEKLNALILSKRSIDMTIQELTGMGVDPKDVIAAAGKLGDDISKAAVEYATASIQGQNNILKARGARASVPVTANVESPIDYVRTQIKKMPLSADSIKMDAQYFSNEENRQGSESVAHTIKTYVAASTSFLGTERSVQAGASAQAQISSQYQNHDVAGTLVITAGCTHKDAALLAPLIIDPDKAIRVWNEFFPGDAISTDHPEQMVASVINAKTSSPNALKLLSGATYGSSFVGMVHVLRSESTRSNQTMLSAAANMQAMMKTGSWFANAEGGFGVSESFSADVKRLLSMQQVNSHCSVITMGSIPSIKSNMVKLGVKQFAEFDGAAMMEKLAALQNATATDMDSVAAAAEAARTGGQMTQMQATQIKSVMSGLSDLDARENKMLDINSLMTAFEDYVDKALAGNIGVPINYYLKSLTKSALAHLWVAKYYPQYLAISEDDTERPAPKAG
ncbi:hypothetical protein [Cystobacter fuscus]|uniref:hypothetical protein n=1 Tax=Cystobacter fuscus TaxID=43 RepID=UPI002B2CE19A|nr:hypothetical protein F0U63_17520 [Cystobacter fuscus]